MVTTTLHAAALSTAPPSDAPAWGVYLSQNKVTEKLTAYHDQAKRSVTEDKLHPGAQATDKVTSTVPSPTLTAWVAKKSSS